MPGKENIKEKQGLQGLGTAKKVIITQRNTKLKGYQMN